MRPLRHQRRATTLLRLRRPHLLCLPLRSMRLPTTGYRSMEEWTSTKITQQLGMALLSMAGSPLGPDRVSCQVVGTQQVRPLAFLVYHIFLGFLLLRRHVCL